MRAFVLASLLVLAFVTPAVTVSAATCAPRVCANVHGGCGHGNTILELFVCDQDCFEYSVDLPAPFTYVYGGGCFIGPGGVGAVKILAPSLDVLA
jgi:hypothetical protein